jgi:mono/diheme cytochrome c family protein
MGLTVDDLVRMSRAERDALIASSPAGTIPEGEMRGTAIVGPWHWLRCLLAGLVRLLMWQGKVFDGASGRLINRLFVIGVRGIRAAVYQGPSWVDQKPCTVLDYSKTSFVAGKIRDEIREVAPGVYLGNVWWGTTKLVHFALEKRRAMGVVDWFRVLLVVLLILILWGWCRFRTDKPVAYTVAQEHFKYGSTGGEKESGIPLAIWMVLPKLFADHVPEDGPGPGYAAFGFLFEEGRPLPIGVSQRNYQGIDRVFLNCAVCHTGRVRKSFDDKPAFYAGMPANTFDVQRFEHFLFDCAKDPRFTPDDMMAAIEREGGLGLDFVNRMLLRYLGVKAMRDQLIRIAGLFRFDEREPTYGPGRVDTFNPPKALLGFALEKIPKNEWIGVVDLPSIWLQGKKRGMQLHWDGNNDRVEERNLSAAFGTGAFPTTADHESIGRMEQWLADAEPPHYPFGAGKGDPKAGAVIYAERCASCHGANGRDFAGERVGKVTPIDEIQTDRARLDSYSVALCEDQRTLYAGTSHRFTRFQKTHGYANLPLDGLWLRAPYLHNGSVPTLWDLFLPAKDRPAKFHRGCDVYDAEKVGFVSDKEADGAHRYFEVDTSIPGNRNTGHEGHAYGTDLSDGQRHDLIEFLKSF